MNEITQAFEKHIKNEYPPDYVFYADPEGDVRHAFLEDVEALSDTHRFVGMTSDSITHSHLIKAGNLPILELVGAE